MYTRLVHKKTIYDWSFIPLDALINDHKLLRAPPPPPPP